jgi:hypothetical protein
MKKLALAVLLTMIAAAAFAGEDAKDDSLNGGFCYWGFQTTWQPQTALDSQLSSLGYSGLSDIGMGMIYGGGFLHHNVFLGGWGAVDFGSSTSVNTNASMTIVKDSGCRGGIEVGYAVLHSPNFTLIPAFDLIWGGADYTFETNISLSNFIKNPVSFAPDFNTGNFSIGASLMALVPFKENSFTGLLLKVTYLYSLSDSYGPANFTDVPVLGKQTVTASVSFAFGGYDRPRPFSGDTKPARVIRDLEDRAKEKATNQTTNQ